MIETRNPSTGKLIQTYPMESDEIVLQKIIQAHKGYQQWRHVSLSDRAEKVRQIAQKLLLDKERLARLIVSEMGKPFTAACLEIEKCAWVCDYYATHAMDALKPMMVETELSKSMVVYQPLGVVLGIMPWNFPFWQVFRYAIPTLMAGNTTLLKHAPITTGCALAIAQLWDEILPFKSVFQTLVIEESQVESIIAHPFVVGVTLTGSERAGRAVGALAGQHLKRAVLELGGSDPYIILEDADLAWAARAVVRSRLNNAGQSCIAAKRVIVMEAVYEAFLAYVQEEMKVYEMGDPQAITTGLGPLARLDLRDTLHRQVLESVEKGALLVCGGEIPQGEGYYYPVTLLTKVAPGMPAFDEELFGPVLAMISVATEAEAIDLANQTNYGLGAAIFTQNVEHGESIAVHQIESGTCFVNQWVASDPRLPFGGIKQSGFGRELSSFGLREFVNIKTIGVRA